MNPLPLATPSLRLRHIVVEEAGRMMELNGEPSTRQWLPSHVYAKEQEATERMRYLISCYSSPGDPRLGPYVLAVDHLASGTLLGHVGFSPFDTDVEVSYAIAESYRGHGYGTEALLQACQWAASSFGLPSLLALTESDNTPSRRTLERAKFIHAEDTVMHFQGTEKTVSRYRWHPSTGNAQKDRTVHIRPYSSADWNRVCQIHDAARRDELAAAGLEAAYLTLEQTAHNEGFLDYTILVAVGGGKVVGFVAFTAEELAWLYVDPEAYGQGFGTQLIRAALAETTASMSAEVLMGNSAALAVYRKAGFEVVGIEHGQMPGNENFNVAVTVLRHPGDA